MTYYYIDQSGKIEQTERHTVISLTNNRNWAVLLRKSDKRTLQSFFRNAKNSQYFPYLTFTALLALLINLAKPKKKIIIDREYLGHENLILNKLAVYLENCQTYSIEFGHVGKLSKAHNYGYEVAVGKKKPDKTVSVKEIINLILGIKKSVNDCLTQEWIPGDQQPHRLK